MVKKMGKVIIWFIKLYQSIPITSHGMCRFTPTCSQYMIDAINMHGSFKGIWLGIKRIFRCRPGGGFGFDPVPEKEKK